ncbi:MAG: MBL fold metallo-hydrolase [Methanotrichaceae archaeon]|nr:MBL fold metallo-hydrolase [Methanotrichaceae archaeon]
MQITDHIHALKIPFQITDPSGQKKAWIEDVDLQAKERPVPGFRTLVGGSVQVDCTLQEGDVLHLGGGLTLKVLHTPGHSPDSISLWLAEEGALFSADAIPIVGDMPIYQDILASVRSIEKLASIPEIKHLLAAWDEPRAGSEAYRIILDALARMGYVGRDGYSAPSAPAR